MGNSSSSAGRHQEDTVDYGALVPQGVYTGPRDWNQPIVSQLIAARKLAPFYRPLEEYESTWDDDQILAARKEFPEPTGENPDNSTRVEAAGPSSSHHSSKSSSGKRPNVGKEFRPEAAIYRGAVECPICFLYYPQNINHSRCCDQAICTECFVQIKRAEPTTTHIVSEPAACPYCVQDNFGIVYSAPPWRAGIGSEGCNPITPAEATRQVEQANLPTHKRRQKSYSADSPEVVTTDQIRPDWEAKLAAVRAAVQRRANRRIIMRQVGDRLIPVGIGRIQTPEEAAAEAANGGSRRRRHHNPPPNGEYAQYMGMSGQDLEELMLMEAMRLSMIDHEEHQKKEADEKRKKEATGAEAPSDASGELHAGSSSQSASTSQTTSQTPNSSISRTTEPSTFPAPRSPPPFSTLNAAFLTSGTASAFLNSQLPSTSSSTTPGQTPAVATTSNDEVPTVAASSVASSPALNGELHSPLSVSSSSATSVDPSLSGLVTYSTLPSSPEPGGTPLLGAANGNNVNPSSLDSSSAADSR
ncbi:hypothetical protein FA15DRAFT_586626 [Coprinopsis marcescibilis]|uniref:RING-type domain-containing protein n=1 Tax=Coprinopsis marcescibilis TaxID=230819 RepID=A0A5C3L2V8_COPMA|nr:hypothetical protein FA15DRAFT_586626 [Coprinopsis marcescibilis]